MSVSSRALSQRRRTVQRACVGAAVVAAGATALTIQSGADPTEATTAIPRVEAVPAAPTTATVQRITVTPEQQLAVESPPVDPIMTALVARYDLSEPAEELAATADEDVVDEDAVDGAVDDEDASAGADPQPAADETITTTHVPLETWEAVARCESGYGGEPDWSIDTGNGYYGGLQFSLRSWEWVGGTGHPHEASKATQIEMAERLWERQGWDAWPACSRQLGLR